MKPVRSEAWTEALLWLAGLFLCALGAGLLEPGPAGFELGPPAPDAYRVVTWNVGGPLPGGGHALADGDLEHVAAVLVELRPHLCVLQEVEDGSQLARLRDELPGRWSIAIAPPFSGGRVAVLAPEGRLDPFYVDNPPLRALGVVHRRPSDTDVRVMGLHANAFHAQLRNLEAGSAVQALFAEPPPRLLLGDLNVDIDLDKRRDLFTDDEYLDVETYNYVATRLLDAAEGRGSTAEPDRRLDYVFVEEDRFEVLAAGPWKGRRSPAMDHDPVVADLRLIRE